MLELLTRTLLLISNALLYPVIFAIFGLLLWTLILGGGFLREWFERRTLGPALEAALSNAGVTGESLATALAPVRTGLPHRFAQLTAHNASPSACDHALRALENDIASALARHSFITRIAPIFGLMGTLIPLGPALNGLAAGDMNRLSGNLIVAFTATVVGLLISGLSYGMGLTRRIWYARDLTALEALVDTASPAPAQRTQAVQYA